MPKLETLVDAFNTSLDKATIWAGSSAATVWDASGRVKIPITTSYWNLGTPGTGSYDFTGSYVYAKITPPSAGNGSREFFMEVIRGGVSNDKLSLFVTNTDISAKRTLAGVLSGQASAIPYVPANHAWWRIRESAGTTYFDTSANGTTWVNLWSVLNGFAVTNVWLNFTTGYWGTESASDAYVDNINTLGEGSIPLTKEQLAVTDLQKAYYGSVGSVVTNSISDNERSFFGAQPEETISDAKRRYHLVNTVGAVYTDSLAEIERKYFSMVLGPIGSTETNADAEYRMYKTIAP